MKVDVESLIANWINEIFTRDGVRFKSLSRSEREGEMRLIVSELFEALDQPTFDPHDLSTHPSLLDAVERHAERRMEQGLTIHDLILELHALRDRISQMASAIGKSNLINCSLDSVGEVMGAAYHRTVNETVNSEVNKKHFLSEQLRSSKHMLELLFELAPEAYFLYDLKGVFIDGNTAARKLSGYEKDELIGENVFSTRLLPPSETRKALGILANNIMGRSTGPDRVMIERKDGKRILVELTTEPVRFNDHSLVLANARDITERRRSEEELEFKSGLLDEAMDLIFVTDAEGNLLWLNETAAKAHQSTQKDLVGKLIQELLPSEEQAAIFGRLREVAKAGEGSFESVLLTRHGQRIPLELHGRAFRFRDRQVIVHVGRDITERIESEAKLRRSEARFRAIFEESPVSLWQADLSKVKRMLDALTSTGVSDMRGYLADNLEFALACVAEMKVTDVNKATLALYGASDGAVLSEHMNEIIPPEAAATVGDAIACLYEGSSHYHGETSSRTLPGENIHVAIEVVRPPGYEETWSRILVSVVDITERVKASRLSEALNSINETIHSSLDFRDIMQKVIGDARTAIKADAAAIFLREDEELVLRYGSTLVGMPLGSTLSSIGDESLTASIARGETVEIHDVAHATAEDADWARQRGMASLLFVPLRVRDEVLGTVGFCTFSTARDFSADQIDFAKKLGSSLGFAVENANLYATQRNIADSLQEAILTLPESIEGVVFDNLYESATAEEARVGGDLYDIFELEHDQVAVLIGDVSGKGLEAATLTSLIKNSVRAFSYQEGSPAAILSKVNQVFLRMSPPSMFASVFFGILDKRTGRLRYCNAGHPPAMLRRHRFQVDQLDADSPIVGAFSGFKYQDHETVLHGHDTLFLYTDGVTEARCGGTLFGETRLHTMIGQMEETGIARINHEIFNEISACSGGRLADDVAMMSVALASE